MSDNNYDALEDQIGNLGGVPETNEPQEEKTLGKLKHADQILGRKGDLDDSDKASLEEFRKNVGRQKEAAHQAQVSMGWIPVDREELGIRSQFYPADWRFFIKAAPVMSIKNWTAVDETRADQVNQVMNEIIRTSVRVENGRGESMGWGSVNSWDRFWFILKIREATFHMGECKIEFEDNCSECDTDILYTLTSDALFYEFPDADIVEKHWDGEKWNIDPADYNVSWEPITLYTPKLAKDQMIIDWAQQQARSDKKLDENFIKYLVWMIPKLPRDLDVFDRQVTKLYKEYKSWSIEFAEFMDDVIRNITIDPQETLRIKCPNCGGEATSKVRFPNGIKQLFRTETKATKFGSR